VCSVKYYTLFDKEHTIPNYDLSFGVSMHAVKNFLPVPVQAQVYMAHGAPRFWHFGL
jgi:hypothetical protein